MGVEIPQGTDLNLRFEITGLSGQALQATYEVQNVTQFGIYLFNGLYRRRGDDGLFMVDPNLVWVDIIDGTINMMKGIPEVPEWIDPYAFIIPCATLLPAGGQLVESFTVPLPVRPYNPYTRDPVTVTGDAANTLVFSLGYWPATSPPRMPPTMVNTTAGPSLFVNVSPYDQRIVKAAPISVYLPISA